MAGLLLAASAVAAMSVVSALAVGCSGGAYSEEPGLTRAGTMQGGLHPTAAQLDAGVAAEIHVSAGSMDTTPQRELGPVRATVALVGESAAGGAGASAAAAGAEAGGDPLQADEACQRALKAEAVRQFGVRVDAIVRYEFEREGARGTCSGTAVEIIAG